MDDVQIKMKHPIRIAFILFSMFLLMSCKNKTQEDPRIELLRDTSHSMRMQQYKEIIERQERNSAKLDSILNWQRRFLDTLRQDRSRREQRKSPLD